MGENDEPLIVDEDSHEPAASLVIAEPSSPTYICLCLSFRLLISNEGLCIVVVLVVLSGLFHFKVAVCLCPFV